jgi:adenylate cyclase
LDRLWLVEGGLVGTPMATTLNEFCGRLNAVGIRVARGRVTTATLHPLVRAESVIWKHGTIIEAGLQHDYLKRTAWRESPFKYMIETQTACMTRRLVGPDARLDYPVLREFRDAGHTEWMGLLIGFGWTSNTRPGGWLGLICSWTTDGADGWTEFERRALAELSRTLALALKGSTGFAITRDLLTTYLGRDAAERVIAGQVQRGTVGKIDAGLLYADLRGFTDFAEVTEADLVATRLNVYLGCMSASVEGHGGQILKFLGDGLLAVFMSNGASTKADVCKAAFEAARDILKRVARLNAEAVSQYEPPLAVDIGLHEGVVLYGNVGAAQRLDFTVIGPAVNEAARLESLCRELGTNLLISHSFYAQAGALQARMVSLGLQRLRGVREPREVFMVR